MTIATPGWRAEAASSQDERRRYGIYATPRPVVDYLLRSVDFLLRSRLGRAAGLADGEVRLVDPAAGPANFVLAAWREAITFQRRRGGSEQEMIRDHLLPHFLGVEVREAAWSRGCDAMRRFLKVLDYPLGPAEPLPALLANSLTPPPELLPIQAPAEPSPPPPLPFGVGAGGTHGRGGRGGQGVRVRPV